MSLAGVFFVFSAVAFVSTRSHAAAIGSTLMALLGCSAMFLQHGVLRGALLSAMAAMTVASVLALLLPPRAQLALPCAFMSALAGFAAWAASAA
jgi:hypothetical protein